MGNCLCNTKNNDEENLIIHKEAANKNEMRKSHKQLVKLQKEHLELKEELAQLEKLRTEENIRSTRIINFLIEENKGWMERKHFCDMLTTAEKELEDIIRMQKKIDKATQTC